MFEYNHFNDPEIPFLVLNLKKHIYKPYTHIKRKLQTSNISEEIRPLTKIQHPFMIKAQKKKLKNKM
jgi:hypothetical protein